MALKNLVHEFQIVGLPAREGTRRSIFPGLQIVATVAHFAPDKAAIDIRDVMSA